MILYYNIIILFVSFTEMLSFKKLTPNKNLFYSMNTYYPFKLHSKRTDIESNYIRNIKSKHTFHEKDVEKFLIENEFIKDKKLVSISPGGFKGFYVMGICKYIKNNYDLDNFIFSGASAGAWNSLLLCFNRDIDEIQNNILDSTLQNTNKISDIENRIKNRMLESYKTEDFDLRKLFIGVTTFDNNQYKPNTTIFTGFDNLEDALNCCIASSHIPLITGGFTNVYRDILSFDGGFSKYPYLNTTKAVLHITPNIWKKKNKTVSPTMSISDYTTLFSKAQYKFSEMVDNGYKDSIENKKTLDDVFNIKTI
jgi:Patatin-like phospholipase